MTTLRGLARLVRVSIALSPVADGVLAAVLAHASGASVASRVVLPSCLASLCLFLFGMALNDRCDLRADAIKRPDRPIPSGAVSARAAAIVCAVALIAAVGFALVAASGRPLALGLLVGLVLSIALYDAAPAHLGPLGPVLLGAIRGQNVLFTAAALGAESAVLPVALGYATYIGVVGWIARCEDGAVPPTRRRLVAGTSLLVAAALATAVISFRSFAPSPFALPAIAAAVGIAAITARLVTSLRATLAVTPIECAPIARFVGACLSSIFLFHAATAGAAGAIVVAAAFIACHFVARALARRFPPS